MGKRIKNYEEKHSVEEWMEECLKNLPDLKKEKLEVDGLLEKIIDLILIQ